MRIKLLDLPTACVVGLNVAGWAAIHLGAAWLFTRLPGRLFSAERRWARPRAWEARVYRRFVGVRLWKRLLPDGAPWVGGVAKRNLRSADAAYLRSFVTETRRGEAAHWAMLLAGGVFLLWNPPWAVVVMAGYAVAANVPCIIALRYNRFRLRQVLRPGHARFRPEGGREVARSEHRARPG